jgi:putative ABC transport system substrate-binding protein
MSRQIGTTGPPVILDVPDTALPAKAWTTTRRGWMVTMAAGIGLLPWCAAQPQGRPRRIGVLSGGYPQVNRTHALVVGLQEQGYKEGRDFVVEWRFAEGRYERLAGFADELVRLEVDLIVALNTRAAYEAERATRTIPIVFASISDPLGSGLVANLARPGGNATGVSVGLDDTIVKHLDLMRATVPSLSRLGVLLNPDSPLNASLLEHLQSHGKGVGVSVAAVPARSVDEMQAGFPAMKAAGAQGTLVFDDALFITYRRELADAAARAKLPAIAANREYADAGLLYSYGGLITEQFRRAAYYIDRIFKGARAGDLPVEQPTRFFFVVNLRTARALGVALPQDLLLRADVVIE